MKPSGRSARTRYAALLLAATALLAAPSPCAGQQSVVNATVSAVSSLFSWLTSPFGSKSPTGYPPATGYPTTSPGGAHAPSPLTALPPPSSAPPAAGTTTTPQQATAAWRLLVHWVSTAPLTQRHPRAQALAEYGESGPEGFPPGFFRNGSNTYFIPTAAAVRLRCCCCCPASVLLREWGGCLVLHRLRSSTASTTTRWQC